MSFVLIENVSKANFKRVLCSEIVTCLSLCICFIVYENNASNYAVSLTVEILNTLKVDIFMKMVFH